MAKLNLPKLNEVGVVSAVKTENELKTNSTQKRRKCKCGVLSLLLSGLILIMLGALSIKYTIFDIILLTRLNMTPGFPPYELWLSPKPEVRLNVYLFTVDNANEFLNGTDVNIKIKEIGPIVYREYLRHKDVVFHENSTLSYTAVRWVEFQPHANEPGILNKTIIVPNFAVLAAASYMNDANLVSKMLYNVLHRSLEEGVFMNISIYDYLWNYESQLLQTAMDLVPFMVPTVNSGILHGFGTNQPNCPLQCATERNANGFSIKFKNADLKFRFTDNFIHTSMIYHNFTDRYNVRIGSKYGNAQFFQINTYNGATTVPGYDISKGDCYASLENATEGAMYRQNLRKETVIWFWRKSICRKVALHFEKEMQIGPIPVYKYSLRKDSYDRLVNKTGDCYKGRKGDLQDGLTDVSKCYFDLPFAASPPHFYGRENNFKKKFEGLNANEENHSSFTIIEPNMGIPINQAARSQLNLVIPKLEGFAKEYQLFSDMILPLFWVEYSQKNLTPDIIQMLDFVINVLPIIQYVITFALIFAGVGLVLLALVFFISSKWHLRIISEKSQLYHPSLYHKTNFKLEGNAGMFESNTFE